MPSDPSKREGLVLVLKLCWCCCVEKKSAVFIAKSSKLSLLVCSGISKSRKKIWLCACFYGLPFCALLPKQKLFLSSEQYDYIIPISQQPQQTILLINQSITSHHIISYLCCVVLKHWLGFRETLLCGDCQVRGEGRGAQLESREREECHW